MLWRFASSGSAWHVAQVRGRVRWYVGARGADFAGRPSCVPWHAVHVGAGARACARRLPWAPPASPPGTAAWQSAQRTRGSRSWGAVAVVWHARQSSPPCADPFSAAPSTKSETGRPGRGGSRLRARSAGQGGGGGGGRGPPPPAPLPPTQRARRGARRRGRRPRRGRASVLVAPVAPVEREHDRPAQRGLAVVAGRAGRGPPC